MTILTQERLKQVLRYDSETGQFSWLMWGATAFHNGKRHFAGLFDAPEQASIAAKELRDSLFTHHHTSHAA